MTEAFFRLHDTPDGEWIEPTDLCRGPWDPEACHAGPPTGMLVRASERLLPHQRFVRITVDLTRPVPQAGFRIIGEVIRSGRTVSTAALTMVDGNGKAVLSARTLHMAPQPNRELPTTPAETPRLADTAPGLFPIHHGAHSLPFFPNAVEMRYPPGHDHLPGPTTAWMRTVPLIGDDDAERHGGVSGFTRICPLADCGNAISRNAEAGDLAFMNTDLTVVLHREPVGEWFGTQSVSRWEADGVGVSDSLLFDEEGAVGRAIQSLIIQSIGGS
jgi:hypothetical protein